MPPSPTTRAQALPPAPPDLSSKGLPPSRPHPDQTSEQLGLVLAAGCMLLLVLPRALLPLTLNLALTLTLSQP